MGVNRSKKEENLTDEEVKNQLKEGLVPNDKKNVVQNRDLDLEKAFESLSPEDQAAILAVADQIDLDKVDNIMDFGSEPLVKTYEQCGKFLKDSRGSDADQKVIKDVLDLIQKANKTYEDFNLTIKEPNALQKALLKFFKFANKNRIKKIDQVAITNFNLLEELKASCNLWINNLEKSMDDISESFYSDLENVTLLEKYIIAGRKALPRLEAEVKELQDKASSTGLQQDYVAYENANHSLEMFNAVLSNLDKSRLMYYLSGGELKIIANANMDTRAAIKMQVNNNAALIGQQLRNGIHNENNRQAIEGQKALNVLNEEVMKYVAESVKGTSIDAKKLMYTGIYDLNAAKIAIKTVIDTGNEVRRLAEELLPKMQAENKEINQLIKELQPEVAKVEGNNVNLDTTKNKSLPRTTSGLKF